MSLQWSTIPGKVVLYHRPCQTRFDYELLIAVMVWLTVSYGRA